MDTAGMASGRNGCVTEKRNWKQLPLARLGQSSVASACVGTHGQTTPTQHVWAPGVSLRYRASAENFKWGNHEMPDRIEQAMGELGAAIDYCPPAADQIFMEHVRTAHRLVTEEWRARQEEAAKAHPKCRFCGDRRPLDQYGYCHLCNDGMERTKGD